MTYAGAAFPYRCPCPLTSLGAPALDASTSAGIAEPSEAYRHSHHADVRSLDVRLEAAIRKAYGDDIQALRTILTMPGFGCFEMAVQRRAPHVAVQVRCDTPSGYAWLSAKRALLELRLARALCSPVSIDVSIGTPP